MDNFLHNSTSLELSIAVPAFSSSPSSGESSGGAMKQLDINQAPSATELEECMEEEDDDSPNNNGTSPVPRKKLRLTKEQSRLLEESFLQNHTLNPKEKEALAVELKLKARQVEVWFQNRRARSKMKQTEMECEYLKRWFGTLIEQNRRLQKEVEELRAIKVAPPHRRQPLPHTTMCPRCERLITTTTTTTTTLLEKRPAAGGVSAATASTTSKNKMHAISTTPHYVL
ncbi:Homeobox-leucine zipper protein ATHB-17 [Sesamum alatum]|uniref:Homeobox-leucine zipper protein ATHB-17 n=1 Tax=Sesamum alatum TaxID=300844 RepID=A0AAE1YHH0_9LAMI|nr:Homeobox-leucine zipper protein ATHB-17 [Sesamum alatum]